MPVIDGKPLFRRFDLAATVGTPSIQYEQMADKWLLVEALRGGTDEMRRHRTKLLPQNPKESDEAYQNRLKKTFLYNLYWRTITAVTGLAFVKPVVVTDVPSELEYLEHNFDGMGRSITEVAYDMTVDCIHYGKAHGMMDFPQVDTEQMTRGEFMQSGYRPYFANINPRNLVGWRTSHEPGIPTLQQVRVVESHVVASEQNQWADKEIYYVRVYHPGYTDVYKYDPEFVEGDIATKGTSEGYEWVDRVENSLDYIPISTAYSNKTGFFEAEPALYDLAQVNLNHWQSSSEQNNILHVARVPFILASGFQEGELDSVEIGPNRMIVSSNDDADVKYVEHNGRGIGAGRDNLKDLEMQMATLGADMLVSKGVARMTATARRLDQNESMSILQMTLKSIEQMIQQLYWSAGDWLDVDASGVKVSVGDDLSTINEPNPTNALVTLLESGLLTDDQIVEEAKRQGILSSFFKLSDERPRAQEGFLEEEHGLDHTDDEAEFNEDDEDEQGEDNGEVRQEERQGQEEQVSESDEEFKKLLLDYLRR